MSHNNEFTFFNHDFCNFQTMVFLTMIFRKVEHQNQKWSKTLKSLLQQRY